MTTSIDSITKADAEIALVKYDIEFGYPNNCSDGSKITVWSDYYHRTKGKTMDLIHAIDGDPLCPFKTRPDIMMNTFRLVRK